MQKQITKVLRLHSVFHNIDIVFPTTFNLEKDKKQIAQIELVFRPSDWGEWAGESYKDEQVFDLTLYDLECLELLIKESRKEIKRTMTTQARIPFVGGAS